MLRVAEHILQTKTANFDPSLPRGSLPAPVLVSMLKEKQAEAQKKIWRPLCRHLNVIDLMDALKRSLAAQSPPVRTSVTKPTPRRTAAASKIPLIQTVKREGLKNRLAMSRVPRTGRLFLYDPKFVGRNFIREQQASAACYLNDILNVIRSVVRLQGQNHMLCKLHLRAPS